MTQGVTMTDSTLSWDNPLGNNYFASQFYLDERGARRYAELVGFQRALAVHDAEAAAHLGSEFLRIVEFISARRDIDIKRAPGVRLRVPSSTVVAGDDGIFGCFTFCRYGPLQYDESAKPNRLLQHPHREGVFTDWRPGVSAEPPQSEAQSFQWAFAYNGAIIYRGPRSADDWRAWKTFSSCWWSSHT